MSKISIIVPCYRVEDYLDRCIESLVNQTLRDIEIVLVDDKSPDRVPQICDEWAKRDSRITVIHKKNNEGLGFARNTGLAVAHGEYVAFVDSDDFVDLEMYEKLYLKCKEDKLDVLYCGFYEYKNDDEKINRKETIQYATFSGHEVLHGMLSPCGVKGRITRYEMSVWHAIYRRDIFVENKVKFCSERELISEDIIFHIDYLRFCERVGFVPDQYYYYCLNESSLSKKFMEDRLIKVDKLCEEIFRRVKDNEYSFPIEDCMNFTCLSIRYPLTMLKDFKMPKDEKLKHINNMINSGVMKKWVNRINWIKLPPRYIIFFLLVKFGMSKLLLMAIEGKNN